MNRMGLIKDLTIRRIVSMGIIVKFLFRKPVISGWITIEKKKWKSSHNNLTPTHHVSSKTNTYLCSEKSFHRFLRNGFLSFEQRRERVAMSYKMHFNRARVLWKANKHTTKDSFCWFIFFFWQKRTLQKIWKKEKKTVLLSRVKIYADHISHMHTFQSQNGKKCHRFKNEMNRLWRAFRLCYGLDQNDTNSQSSISSEYNGTYYTNIYYYMSETNKKPHAKWLFLWHWRKKIYDYNTQITE